MNNYDDIIGNTAQPTEKVNEGQPAQLSKEDFAAKKKAERDQVFALSDTTAMSVSSNGDKFKEFLDVQSRLPRY